MPRRRKQQKIYGKEDDDENNPEREQHEEAEDERSGRRRRNQELRERAAIARLRAAEEARNELLAFRLGVVGATGYSTLTYVVSTIFCILLFIAIMIGTGLWESIQMFMWFCLAPNARDPPDQGPPGTGPPPTGPPPTEAPPPTDAPLK